MAFREERGETLLADVLESADADDPIHWLVELLPSLKANVDPAAQVGQALACQVVLLLTECESDGGDAVLFDSSADGLRS